MAEASREGGEGLSLTEQVEEAVVTLEELSGAETYDHGVLLTSYNRVATLADEALAAGEFDEEKAVRVKLGAANAAHEIATSSADVDTATTLSQLVGAYQSVKDLLEADPSQTPADTRSDRTGNAKKRI